MFLPSVTKQGLCRFHGCDGTSPQPNRLRRLRPVYTCCVNMHKSPPRPIIHYALFAAVRSALVSLSKMLQAVVSWPAWFVVVGGHGGQLRRACLNEICGRECVEEEDERGAAVCSRPTIMFNNVRKFLVYIGPNIL